MKREMFIFKSVKWNNHIDQLVVASHIFCYIVVRLPSNEMKSELEKTEFSNLKFI